ncbi:MAG: response regulator [Pirellulales bacterium]|nr:response regulator [Pirellulales bacterium]
MTPKTVLIADDDQNLVDVLALRCRQLGLNVVVAYDARAAFARICEAHPDVICLDVKMPSGSGLSVCEMLVNDEELSCIPVIMLTGKDDHATIRRCHEMCAFYVLKSPDVWERLRPLLCELLDIEEGRLGGSEASDETAEMDRPATSSREGLRNLVDVIADESIFTEVAENPDNVDANPSDHGRSEFTAEAPMHWQPSHKSPSTSDGGRDRARRMTVLYVEDDVEASNALKLRLESLGLEVIQAFSGVEGYRLAVAHAPDLILCDVILPDGDGNYLLRRFRENPVTEGIPLIFLTGRKGDDLRRRLCGQGAAGYLTKPVALDDLVRELSGFLQVDLPKPQEAASF